MPHIYVSEKDLLDELSDHDLKTEMRNRDLGNCCITVEEADDTLVQSADILRKQGRNDLAFKLDEMRAEFVK